MPRKPTTRLVSTRLRHKAACTSYVVGLLLVFLFSLYLLPHDTGVGRLLFSTAPAES